jgi:hypothetical protein
MFVYLCPVFLRKAESIPPIGRSIILDNIGYPNCNGAQLAANGDTVDNNMFDWKNIFAFDRENDTTKVMVFSV